MVYADRTDEWEQALSQLQKPTKNRFVPENLDTIVKPADRQKRNAQPKHIQIASGIELYHLLDAVHLKPVTQIDIMLQLRQPTGRLTQAGKLFTYLETARDHVMFRVLKSCLKNEVTEKIGYEASLAEIHFKFSSLNDIGVKITIRGYSDKVLDFAKIYLDILIACGKPQSFEKRALLGSMEKKSEAYANSNLEADYRAKNNRTLFLNPQKYHDSYLGKLLDEEIRALTEQDDD